MKISKISKNKFWSKVEKTDNCWNWKNSKTSGYGCVRINSKGYLSHRVSAFLNGKLPSLDSNLFVCHKCDNRACVNPDHLFVGTQKDNMADCSKKNRTCFGERSKSSKLTREMVLDIKKKYIPKIYGYRKLGREFGVDNTTIRSIFKRGNWKQADSAMKDELAIKDRRSDEIKTQV